MSLPFIFYLLEQGCATHMLRDTGPCKTTLAWKELGFRERKKCFPRETDRFKRNEMLHEEKSGKDGDLTSKSL